MSVWLRKRNWIRPRTPGLISLLCPTRGRPYNVKRLMQSLEDTTDYLGSVEVIFRTDVDDPGTIDLSVPLGCRVSYLEVNGPRDTLSQLWNDCYVYSNGEIVMQAADDLVFRTKGWDGRVRHEFEHSRDKIMLLYGDDLYCHQATHGIVHHRWPDSLGYFTPPYFSCDFADTWLIDVATRIDRLRYIPEIVTEHLHPDAGKAEYDYSHIERMARGSSDRVRDIYESMEQERIRDADKLRKLMLP